MTITAKKFTPEVLLSAPRRSSAIPSPDGSLALYTIRVLDLKSGESRILCNDQDARDPAWVGFNSHEVLWLKSGAKGTTKLILDDVRKSHENSAQSIVTFDGPVSNLKIAGLDSETKALAVTGLATPSGDLYNPETAEKPHSSARVYTLLFVRHWDTYTTENTNAIFYASLKRSKKNECHTLKTSNLVNALKGHKVFLESPVPTFGGSGDFDISKNGLVFIAKDPKLNPALYTTTNLYYIPLKTFSELQAPSPQEIKTGSLRGASSSPVFYPDAKSVIFTRQRDRQYESDKPRLLLVADITAPDPSDVQEFFETSDGEGAWDRAPGSITFSFDGEELYVTAEENGREKLFKMPASPRHATKLPKAIVEHGTVTEAKVLPSGKLLVSSNTLVDSIKWMLVDPANPEDASVVSSMSKGGKTFGLHQDQVDEFWCKGGEDYDVHSWLIRPSSFDKKKRYPLALLIHGGPQGMWNDGWSTRWNPAVFAEQGYIVVAPNITGSTGYGMKLQNNIRGEWGGLPYKDLIQCFSHVEKHIPYVDTSRAVALGASYGGYMVNWIQGHEFGRKFKALVTHDGVYNMGNQWGSDELYFSIHEFCGTPWTHPTLYHKWDPSSHAANWATPHLIIHNPLDYRLPIVEGLAAFNVLQTKDIESKFLSFPDENHWVLKPENSLVWHREVFGWINRFSGVQDDQDGNEEVREGMEGMRV